VSAVSDPCSLC